MNFQSILLTAADTSYLGRVDKASLSTQTLMELFIEGIENREVICWSAEKPEDIDKWQGVTYGGEQNASGVENLLKIQWTGRKLVGVIDLQWISPTVFSLEIIGNKLSGSLNLTVLPPSIQVLDLCYNAFSGEIDLCHLPTEMKKLNLSSNHLSGSLSLEELPQSIESLSLCSNRFSGTVCLQNLPRSLQVLSVGANDLSRGLVAQWYVPPTELPLYPGSIRGKGIFRLHG